MAAVEVERAAFALALRISAAATFCLFVSEMFRLQQTSLSVFTCNMAMVLFPYTAFQKVIERFIGRVIGVSYGLALVLFFHDAPILLIALLMMGQMFFFYINASGRLAYAALMGGLFVGVVVEIGLAGSPTAAQTYAVSLVEQLLLASVAIITINGITGAERTVAIEAGGEPFLPLRRDWLSKSAMVSTTQIFALLVAVWLDLPALPTLVSATILAITGSDIAVMGHKALERGLGAIVGGAYAIAGILLLSYMPHFVLLLAVTAFGMFLSAYLCKTSVNYSYTFMQMGIVIPLVLLGSSGELGSVSTATQRLYGIGAGLSIAEVVFFCWPWATTKPVAVGQ